MAITDVVDGFVTGIARRYVLVSSAPKESGISDDEFDAHLTPVLLAAVETGKYPVIAGLEDDALPARWQETLDFGLERLLDGLEQYIGR